MRIPIISKLNDKINIMMHDLNFLGNNLVGILEEANQNIASSLSKSTADIRETTESISTSADTMADTLTQTSQDIRETAENIAQSANTIAQSVGEFTTATTATINQFESAIEKSVDKLIGTIEDFKNEMVQGGIKVNIAKSATSLMPQHEGSFMQGITSGIRDMIIPKRKSKEE